MDLLGNYRHVATRLNLTVADYRIHGVLEGIPLQVWFGPHATHISALLPRPAPIDLSIATTGLVAKLGELFGKHDEQIGDPAFDKAFSVKTSNAARLATLLDPEARKALLDLATNGLHPAVDAHTVHLRRFSQGGLFDDERMIENDFRAAARLAVIVGNSFAGAYR
jgi:hypothetical protein